MRTLVLCAVLLVLPGVGHAYIGPGLGAGTVGVILGILGSILIALFALFWYPIKRIFKNKKTSKKEKHSEEHEDDQSRSRDRQ